MAEYIDKTDLVKRLESRVKDYGSDCNSNAPIISGTYQAVLHMVENLPTADVVPVVRCKDCICSRRLHAEGSKDIFRYCLCDGNFVQDNHYCSCGERRSNDG